MEIVVLHGINDSLMISGMFVVKKAAYTWLHLSLLVVKVVDMMYFLLLESHVRASAG